MSTDFEKDLSSFDKDKRRAALARAENALAAGAVKMPPAKDIMNNHAHTFYSYCSLGLSPYGLVWESAKQGLAVVGSTDFDVLDALPEMYEAGDRLGVKTTVSLESRTFVRGYADKEINSPGEPGVLYSMGVGFIRPPQAGTGAGALFASLLAQSRRRNIDMVAKVNAAMGSAAIDYDRDVIPLTPSGNATERHLCAAYDAKARAAFPKDEDLAAFWAKTLAIAPEQATAMIGDEGALRNAIRAKLMKRGGVGYSQPGPDTFPPIEAFFKMVADAGALPCLAWLDGTSAGEADAGKLLDDAMSWGARIVNIIPDRNWNIKDPAAKDKKLACLAAFMNAARERNLLILAGTELNGPGQKFVDSFDAPELAPYVDDFRDAAYFLFGHTVLGRLAGMGAVGDWAAKFFGDDRAKVNAFYARIGRAATAKYMSAAPAISAAMAPEAVLRAFNA
jgi:hypothetical protein